jgi:hypothetical protein
MIMVDDDNYNKHTIDLLQQLAFGKLDRKNAQELRFLLMDLLHDW